MNVQIIVFFVFTSTTTQSTLRCLLNVFFQHSLLERRSLKAVYKQMTRYQFIFTLQNLTLITTWKNVPYFCAALKTKALMAFKVKPFRV